MPRDPHQSPVEPVPAPGRVPSDHPPLVLGLAGGIGAGKSAVAHAFARLGCAVIDSDKEAKAALDLPHVQASLKQWWGPGIVGADGTTDRAAVARIVFADPAQRTRLEGLIHPLIRRTRESAQAEARAAGAPAILYDAPLLFEAGLDQLCDAVIWVECPREERLRRVSATRGWTEAELTRREAAQWPVEKKRALCQHEIENGAEALSHLDKRAVDLLAILLREQASP